MAQAHPFLMFQGQADEAIALYLKVLPQAEQVSATHHGPGEGLPEGSVKQATLRFAGLELMIFNSPPMHDFSFTPASSLFVNLDSEAELEALAAALGEGGGVMMPLANYGFSQRYTWLSDRFGVSWQLNLP